jgi:hydroxymethylpyrimidine/phosphomethylpyrimidine kinase
MKRPLCVLTIAGSDSGAGAGIQADSRAIHALGCYALTVVTAITAQNTRGVQSWAAVSPRLLTAQLASVLGDYPVAAIKTGLLPGSGAIRELARALSGHPTIPLVIDPVIGSTTGTRFLSTKDVQTLKSELLPRATVLTPNWPEAAALSGQPVSTFDEAEQAGRRLAAKYGCAVLIKGGHGPGRLCRDCLVAADGTLRWFSSRRIVTVNTHGTGCVLSAALAAELARGRPLVEAVAQARRFLRSALQAGHTVRWGGGAGPAFGG